MHRNENFILRETAGLTVILPVGEASIRFPGMISVNETGAFLWELLEQERTLLELAQALTERYQVELPRAEADAASFLEKLRSTGALAEEG